MDGITLRRLILLSLVLFAVANLYGCATVDLQCGMRADYRAEPPARTGTIALSWAFEQGFAETDRRYGETTCQDGRCVIRLAGTPSFNDVCELARLGHEVVHAMGGSHQ